MNPRGPTMPAYRSLLMPPKLSPARKRVVSPRIDFRRPPEGGLWAYPDQLYGAENALFPWLWNSIPKALMVDAVGRPTVSVVLAGCPTPTSLVGSLIPSGMESSTLIATLLPY